ncbi:hypothetical protein EZS27_019655 [termite gut metagenome]|uniref:Toxin RelG n=1 Tax=termite gut metagenome TaxID=433724 RepID=A0A5J4RE44_9ZZZZ
MRYRFTVKFKKDAQKLPEVYQCSLDKVITSIENAGNIKDIQCKKIVGTRHSYRIRMGTYRIMFIVKILVDNTVIFQRVLPRSEVYNKEYIQQLLREEKRQK